MNLGKLLIAGIVCLLLNINAQAQWTTSGTNIYNSNTGFVGFKTTTPDMPITIQGGIRVDAAGQFDTILTTGPINSWLTFGASGSGEGIASARQPTGVNYVGLTFYTSFKPRVLITNAGNLVIGKTTQANSAYQLDVYGPAHASKVVVNTTGADFVFDKDYRLPPLDEVAAYVSSNHHLPGIASADEMTKNGLDLGQNQTLLLQKVEELTLYLIELKKENEVLKARLDRLEVPGSGK